MPNNVKTIGVRLSIYHMRKNRVDTIYLKVSFSINEIYYML
jgi:hypothetical protein